MAKLTRNSQVVKSNLVKVDERVVCKVPCRIQVPARYMDIGLGETGATTIVYGCFVLILETGEYSVCSITALVQLGDSSYKTVKIDDVTYYEFSYGANDTIIVNTSLVKRDTIMYNIFNEFISQGKIPWYMEYEDMGKLFDTSSYHAGSNIGQSLEVIELLVSIITRSNNDRVKYIRNCITSYDEASLSKIDYVPLTSVFYSIETTLNKLAGNYFNDGIVSSLVNKSSKVTKVERILRT